MTFEEILDQALGMLQRRGRVTYRTLRRQFQLDDDALEDLKAEIITGQRLAVDEDGEVLVWTGDAPSTPPPKAAAPVQGHAPRAYTPAHLTEKILASRAALEGERKQVTVLFADLKGSMELLADRDPEDARQLLDPVLDRMMAAVHRYEGTVNQVMGDGIMALFGAPIAHEDHAMRACYAALRMQESVKQYAVEVQRTKGVALHIRVGLNAGEVVVRSIGSDLHMDYTDVGQTTHLAARMEQLAMPGNILITPEVLRLVEGYVQVTSLGPVAVKGLRAPVEVYELVGAGPVRSRLRAAALGGLTRFVARDRELDDLDQALQLAGSGHGQVVALVGEAGVGKSRLLYEFIHSPRTQGWVALEAASVSYGKATPYFPVIDLLKRYLHIEEGDEAHTVRAKVTEHLLTLDEALQALLGHDPGLAPLTPLLIARTDGNPFFLEESVRTLVERGVLMGEPGAYRLAQALATIQVPATVQAVLAARIDRLPPEEKRLLQTAAVIGKDVPVALLQAIAELPEEELRRGLTHLQAAEFLHETSLFPELESGFSDLCVRRVFMQLSRPSPVKVL